MSRRTILAKLSWVIPQQPTHSSTVEHLYRSLGGTAARSQHLFFLDSQHVALMLAQSGFVVVAAAAEVGGGKTLTYVAQYATSDVFNGVNDAGANLTRRRKSDSNDLAPSSSLRTTSLGPTVGNRFQRKS